MTEVSRRMTASQGPPNDSEIAEWMGEEGFQYWNRVKEMIAKNYPNLFAPEWLFGGKKHGWSLRYKKGRSFCIRGCKSTSGSEEEAEERKACITE